jgi:hypothetical protein
MRLYVGVDLHANNIFVAMIDKKGKRLEQNKLPNCWVPDYLHPKGFGFFRMV